MDMARILGLCVYDWTEAPAGEPPNPPIPDGRDASRNAPHSPERGERWPVTEALTQPPGSSTPGTKASNLDPHNTPGGDMSQTPHHPEATPTQTGPEVTTD